MQKWIMISLLWVFCFTIGFACDCPLQKTKQNCLKTTDRQQKQCTWDERKNTCSSNDVLLCRRRSMVDLK